MEDSLTTIKNLTISFLEKYSQIEEELQKNGENEEKGFIVIIHEKNLLEQDWIQCIIKITKTPNLELIKLGGESKLLLAKKVFSFNCKKAFRKLTRLLENYKVEELKDWFVIPNKIYKELLLDTWWREKIDITNCLINEEIENLIIETENLLDLLLQKKKTIKKWSFTESASVIDFKTELEQLNLNIPNCKIDKLFNFLNKEEILKFINFLKNEEIKLKEEKLLIPINVFSKICDKKKYLTIIKKLSMTRKAQRFKESVFKCYEY